MITTYLNFIDDYVSLFYRTDPFYMGTFYDQSECACQRLAFHNLQTFRIKKEMYLRICQIVMHYISVN